MSKTFKQVEIHSESDLPKESGRYIVHLKETDTTRDFPFYDTETSVGLWNKFIDWYLIEEEQPKDELTLKIDLLISFQIWWLKNSSKYSVDDTLEKIATDFLD